MGKLILFAALFFLTGSLCAQQGYTDTSLLSPGIRHLRQVYDAQRGDESAVYNGIQHFPYSPAIEGIGYFRSTDWQKGSVVYEDILYTNIFMKYDEVKEELVVTPDEKGGLFVSLFSPRVKEFSFSGVKFIRLGMPGDGTSLPEGFYRQLAAGKVTAFVRVTKTIREIIEGTTITRKFEDKIRYYVLADGMYTPVRNTSDLLDAMKGHRKEIQRFLGDQKLKYRKNPEQTITAAVKFYNQSGY
jgi:hypothetical protein